MIKFGIFISLDYVFYLLVKWKRKQLALVLIFTKLGRYSINQNKSIKPHHSSSSIRSKFAIHSFAYFPFMVSCDVTALRTPQPPCPALPAQWWHDLHKFMFFFFQRRRRLWHAHVICRSIQFSFSFIFYIRVRWRRREHCKEVNSEKSKCMLRSCCLPHPACRKNEPFFELFIF